MSRILVVDDESSVRRLLIQFLQSQGHETLEAEGGDQALAMAAEARPDLVLLDIDMPGRDGLATLRRLRLQSPDLPVVMVSGIQDEPRALQALEDGACDFVRKPFDLKRLREVVLHQLALAA